MRVLRMRFRDGAVYVPEDDRELVERVRSRGELLGSRRMEMTEAEFKKIPSTGFSRKVTREDLCE